MRQLVGQPTTAWPAVDRMMPCKSRVYVFPYVDKGVCSRICSAHRGLCQSIGCTPRRPDRGCYYCGGIGVVLVFLSALMRLTSLAAPSWPPRSVRVLGRLAYLANTRGRSPPLYIVTVIYCGPSPPLILPICSYTLLNPVHRCHPHQAAVAQVARSGRCTDRRGKHPVGAACTTCGRPWVDPHAAPSSSRRAPALALVLPAGRRPRGPCRESRPRDANGTRNRACYTWLPC